MSMDLAFWRYKNGETGDHTRIYEQICDGVLLDCLEQLPVDKIRGRIAEAFGGWTALDPDTYDKDGNAGFQIFTTPQGVVFNCGGMTGDEMNLIIDIMLEFGCPLYDPQITTRFDT